ncbi:MAG: hypothetical protein A2Z37_00125 [Chloroflexi bacterium RBG_19FT_COMBO_62_14]|nr:MAG: hypothetical protein A2Z37_00125 [Chloroflexi bacterium RBG_19FT_COMBO_62_14]
MSIATARVRWPPPTDEAAPISGMASVGAAADQERCEHSQQNSLLHREKTMHLWAIQACGRLQRDEPLFG